MPTDFPKFSAAEGAQPVTLGVFSEALKEITTAAVKQIGALARRAALLESQAATDAESIRRLQTRVDALERATTREPSA